MSTKLAVLYLFFLSTIAMILAFMHGTTGAKIMVSIPFSFLFLCVLVLSNR